MDLSQPAFLQGVYSFTGSGLERPAPLEGAVYKVPGDKRAQLIYFRAGNTEDALINLVLLLNGKPIRYFPLGSRASLHVSMAVVEDLFPDSVIELQIAAPEGVAGTAVVDIGFVEI